MSTGVFQTSFSGGELSPNLFAREDIEKYASGAALMRNFFVDYRGGASNRPGTEFKAICASDGLIRLIPFVFSTDQAYILELSDFLIRIYRDGAFIEDVVSPWPEDVIYNLKFVQSADVMTLVHPDFPPYNLSRTTAVTFSLDLTETGPSEAPPTTLTATPSTAGNLRYGYMVTALTKNGEESLGSFPATADSVALDPTNATPKTIALNWDTITGVSNYNIYKWGPVPVAQPLPTLFGYIGQSKTSSFTDTNIAPDYSRVPPEFRDPFAPGQITDIEVTAAGAGYTGYVALTISGDGAGAEAYAIADGTGAITGVVITNNGHDYTTATVTPASGAATFDATIDLLNHYPSVVSYFQQRRVYGGAADTPELLEFSQVGAYNNFDVSPAVLDSDAITVNIASRQVNDIKSLVPMSTGLIVFTTGCAFLVAGANNAAVSPSSVSAVPQASTGSNDIPPITVNYNILFVQQKGAIVRDMAFSFQTQSYYGVDRSMLANHLFFGYSIVDWTWSEEPYKLLWIVRNDGQCLVMTYVPDQEVYGWSCHDTNGLFKSVCSVPGSNQDDTYFVVRRFVQETKEWKNYFEKLSFRTCDCPADAAFLDSFVETAGTPGSSTIQITRGDGDQVTITNADGGDIAAYTMEAKQMFPADYVSVFNSTGDFPSLIIPVGVAPGATFDPVTRTIAYCAMIWSKTYPWTSVNGDAINTTGSTLWDGVTSIAPGASFYQTSNSTFYLLRKNIDTGVIQETFFYTPDSTVPSGIDGSDGTWRRSVFGNGGIVGAPLFDPFTGNYAADNNTFNKLNVRPGQFYIFQKTDGYKHTISPLQASDPAYALLSAGVTADWWYVIEYTSASPPKYTSIRCVPTSITAPEIAADYLLSYADYNFPSDLTTDECTIGSVLGLDDILYLTSYNVDTNAFTLWTFEPPTSAPFGGPVVGGGFTDVTPWALGAGPDATTAAFTMPSPMYALMWYTPAVDAAGPTLSIITRVLALNTGAYTDFSLFLLSHTKVDLSDMSTSTDPLVQGLMTDTWGFAATLDDAAFAVMDAIEFNSYAGRSSFDHSSSASEVYTKRTLAFVCRPVVNGVVDTDNVLLVVAQYNFSADMSVPELLSFVTDTQWTDKNPGYSRRINQPYAVQASVFGAVSSGIPTYVLGTATTGLYDQTTNSFWMAPAQNSNLKLLNLRFNYPNANIKHPAVGGWDTYGPFLRLSAGLSPGNFIDIACGTILVTDQSDPTTFHGELLSNINHAILDDPFGTIAPIQPADWRITEATNTLVLTHLLGMQVTPFVDGLVLPTQIVPPSGIITWPEEQATTRALAGLGYQGQLQTMYLTTGQPTTQGRFKLISEIVVRVACTLGIKVGPNFDDLVEMKDCMAMPYGTPPEVFNGDLRANVPNDWNEYGQMVIQQDYPLPATILGVIPQVVIGDDD